MRRHIDADKLIHRLEDTAVTPVPQWIKAEIINAPTADVRENVRGEWLHDEVTMNGNTVYTPNAKCSICDCYVFQESNFCPNCGAQMVRGES